MTGRPISGHFLAAYFNAGIAVTAAEYSIAIPKLSLKIVQRRRERPRLAPFQEYARNCQTKESRIQACEDDITTLLSGSVGRWIGLERHLGYPIDCMERGLLERALRCDALRAYERETDLAYALAFAWLAPRDGGNSLATTDRLWRRANGLLRKPPRAETLERLASELLEKHELAEDAIRRLLP